jgi:hypothetical protein
VDPIVDIPARKMIATNGAPPLSAAWVAEG